VILQEAVHTSQFGIETLEADVAALQKALGPADTLRVILAGDDQRELSFPIERDLVAMSRREGRCVPIYDALARTLMQPSAATRQHVIVLISTGEGRGSVLSTEPVADIARRSNARLYVVGVEPGIPGTAWRSWVVESVCPQSNRDWSASRQPRLRQIEGTPSNFEQWRELWAEGKKRLVGIAELTGGSEIHPTLLTQSNTGPVIKALEDVREGYVLRYTAKGVPDAGWHPISVTIARPGKYDVQTRPGYQR
jgi:uncharacterized protein (UPF0248 family)